MSVDGRDVLLLVVAEQQSFREASGEWFGKHGISWHGAVITVPEYDGQPQQSFSP